eukprot:364476-Chlamydomonas_euryale.AAC.3
MTGETDSCRPTGVEHARPDGSVGVWEGKSRLRSDTYSFAAQSAPSPREELAAGALEAARRHFSPFACPSLKLRRGCGEGSRAPVLHSAAVPATSTRHLLRLLLPPAARLVRPGQRGAPPRPAQRSARTHEFCAYSAKAAAVEVSAATKRRAGRPSCAMRAAPAAAPS